MLSCLYHCTNRKFTSIYTCHSSNGSNSHTSNPNNKSILDAIPAWGMGEAFWEDLAAEPLWVVDGVDVALLGGPGLAPPAGDTPFDWLVFCSWTIIWRALSSCPWSILMTSESCRPGSFQIVCNSRTIKIFAWLNMYFIYIYVIYDSYMTYISCTHYMFVSILLAGQACMYGSCIWGKRENPGIWHPIMLDHH